MGIGKFFLGFSKKEEQDKTASEIYARLNTIFNKNKYGYHTRIMSDFDLLLEAMMNERFIDDSTGYYDDPFTQKEIEDMETGLNGDYSQADIAHLNKDKGDAHHGGAITMRFPDRVGSNYDKSDALSCYKVHPRG